MLLVLSGIRSRNAQAFTGLSLLFLLFFWGCAEDDAIVNCSPTNTFKLEIPPGFPALIIPEDNALTSHRVTLGKKLFFDPILSRDSTVSCGSCHFPHKAFSDTLALSKGVDNLEGMRNAPPLINLAYGESFFRDGGVPTLERQILAPLDCEKELDLDILVLSDRLEKDETYRSRFLEAYDRIPDPYGITRAIAAFERTLISGNSPYDKFEFSGDSNALSEAAEKGRKLFFSETLKCGQCHSGFNFTNENFENNGLYATYQDTGRARITLLPQDVGRFKVPTLRNIELTGPYMHDGSLSSLEAVIDHYASGGSGHVNQSDLVSGFTITQEEKEDLIKFLEALTDPTFINNPDFRE